jgi:hypothetical protein
MVEGEELETIAWRDADEEGVPWVSPVWYAPAQ